MGPPASLHEVVMKVLVPAMNGNPTVQTVGSHSTQRSIHKVPKPISEVKQKPSRATEREDESRAPQPYILVHSSCGSLFTRMRAHVTPGCCGAQIPIYIRLIYHFISRTTHCWGTRWRSWLRHCATSWKVAGSIFH
jgi:hypothetical protein